MNEDKVWRMEVSGQRSRGMRSNMIDIHNQWSERTKGIPFGFGPTYLDSQLSSSLSVSQLHSDVVWNYILGIVSHYQSCSLPYVIYHFNGWWIYMTSYCLNSAHWLCQVTWHSGLLAQLKEHIIVGICCLSHHTCTSLTFLIPHRLLPIYLCFIFIWYIYRILACMFPSSIIVHLLVYHQHKCDTSSSNQHNTTSNLKPIT